ncbi:NAD(P)-dependent oxidoreductase [Methylopila sp. 73B]|uniref:NAD-dependent epimerase/dehydratase family protein n=1 Tax=Methylopila sp. 73B TaxID=1120792 RepID=UPI000379022B|nr:NAD(P)-dependent oxidoreductase [Methylopila sp. 73B]
MTASTASADGPVFVAGGSGFVGLALCEALLEAGVAVTSYDLAPPPREATDLFARLPGAFDAVWGDVRDGGALLQAMARSGAPRVASLAALTAGPERERATPRAIFEVNVGGALAVAEAAAACGAARVVHLSSGSVYGASGRTADVLDENATPLAPEGLYEISKQAAEAAVLRFGALRGLDIRVGRLGTCFGRWERATGARDTPSAPFQILAQALRGEEIVLPRPHPRDWLYARDAAAAIRALLDASNPPRRVYNLGAGHVWPLTALCERLGAARPNLRWRLAKAGEPGTVALYAPYDRASMAIGRLRADTGFTPGFDLDAALADWLAFSDANLALVSAPWESAP